MIIELPRRLSLLSLMLLVLFSSGAAAEEFERWAIHDTTSKTLVDHEPLNRILQLINVKERNKQLVAFSRLQGRALEYAKAYTQYLEAIPVSTLNRDEQLAYWLNLHNIAVITLIAENRNGHKKVKRYRGTPSKPGAVWIEKNLTVEGQTLSLQDIEQHILLTHWQDPLIIYGLYYGVQGSPVLTNIAFTGANVKTRLTKNAEAFINSDNNIRSKRKGIELSSLYEWHKDQLFMGEDSQVLSHVSQHANLRLSQAIAANPQITKHRFNWKSIAFIPRAAPTNLGGGAGYRGAGS